MARSRNLRLWTLALWAVCLLAASGGPLAGAGGPAATDVPPAAVGALSRTPDAAIIPARIAAEVRAGGAAPVRVLVVAAMLAMLAALPALLRRRTAAPGNEHRPLRARRHTISLRAPPLLFA